jgi:hypothetical protein
VLVVAPRALLHPHVPQPAGSLVYELLTGHPEREPHELVFVADLTVELRAWPAETWAGLGVDPAAVTRAVLACWRDGEVAGWRLTGHVRGDPLAGTPRDDLRAGAAARPAGPPSPARPPALAAPKQHAPGGRALPVAHGHRGLARCCGSWNAQPERLLPGLVAISPTVPPSAVVASASGASAAFF